MDWFWPAVLNGDVQGLAWLYDNGYRVLFTKGWNKIRHCDAESIPECLGERGHLDALKWWRSHNFPWDEGTIVMAAFYGHHEVMKWLAENGCPFTEMTHIAATLSEDKHCLGLANHLRMDTLPYSRLPADSIFEWDERDDDEVQELKKFLSMHSQEAFRDGYKKAWLPISSDAATGFTTFKVLSRYVHDEGRGRPTKEPLNAEDWKDFKKKWNINALRCFIHHIRKYSDTDRTNIADPEEARHIHEYRNCPCFYWVDTGSCKKPKITEQLGMK